MRKYILAIVLLTLLISAKAQQQNKLLTGMYLQWGYNTEKYTKSNIHFKGAVNGTPHDFTIYKAVAHDQNDLGAVVKEPVQISVPQYNYRVGFYLNAKKTKAIEINFDHTKYVVYDNQYLHAKGFIGSKNFDKDTSFDGSQIHFEHTNGANFYHINYVRQYFINNKNSRPFLSLLWKAGGGFMIPKTDVTLFGKRLDNKFHLAGYCFAAEAGGRFFINRHLFLEGTFKTGYANYINALTVDGGKAQHSFGYAEIIGLVGYDIQF